MASDARIDRLAVSAYEVPTDAPEEDGTLAWDRTTLVLVEAACGKTVGLGYTYGARAAGVLVADLLAKEAIGTDALRTGDLSARMWRALRNVGRPGLGAMALSAVDVAIWDLKARLLDVPLARLLGGFRESVPAYGSGGFTSYGLERLREQLGGWVERGFTRVKMKVGARPAEDLARVKIVRQALGPKPELMVDANGAYGREQALAFAELYAAQGVTWFEEPVSSLDLEGLRFLRDRSPAGLEIAAGEYASEVADFKRFLTQGAVDVLQADVTRCGGVTGFLRAAALADAFEIPLSSHCAPALHTPLGCAAERFKHLEYFHDHVRVEWLLFEGVPEPVGGALRPDLSRPGLGLTLKREDARRYAVG
jgi:L-alanine-DL-glutamate epimerase-like enolase superfamily enzyme